MKKRISQDMDTLSTLILKYSGIHREYTDEDLSNAMVILAEVLMAKTFDKHRDKVNEKQMIELSKELGISLHRTIETFTGVNLHDIYNE